MAVRIVVGCLALTLLIGLFANTARTQTTAQGPFEAYLPLINNGSPRISALGIETISGRLLEPTVQQRASELGINWIRINTISWRLVQPERDTPVTEWNWEALAVFEEEIRQANAAGLTPMVVVDDHPAWARVGDYGCTALKETHFADYGRFLQELIQRYGAAPYNVTYWELGNEPDVDPKFAQVDNPYVFGCWGDVDDPYYGGEHYGNMLKAVTPMIKATDPAAQVIFGGLLLFTPNTTEEGHGKPERFFEGALRAGAGDSFDILAFHTYTNYLGGPGVAGFDSDRFDPRWEVLGGMTLGKTRYLRDVMQRYGLDKPMMINEAGLLYYTELESGEEPSAEFLAAQADHAVRIFARGMWQDLIAICWYTLDGPGWRASGLLNASQNPRPVYKTIQSFVERTANTIDVLQVTGEYGNPNDVEAYRFVSDGSGPNVDVIWSYGTRQITVPRDVFVRAYTRDGESLAPLSEDTSVVRFQVDFTPIYIYRQ